MKVNFRYLLTISLVTALGGLLFGFDISVISGTIPFIQEVFGLYPILGGLAVGGASALAHRYIAEVSPAHLRGRMVSINQLTIVIGISLEQLEKILVNPPAQLSPNSYGVRTEKRKIQ